MRRFLSIICVLLAFAVGNIHAQDDFNPTNPAEPYTKYKLTTTATPFGYASGAGSYMSGDEVWVNTSAYSQDYKFLYWLKDGVRYSDAQSFYFTMPDDYVNLVAVYEYDPVDPSEPIANYTYRLYLTSNIDVACSFNMSSGTKVHEDSYVTVTAYGNSGYDFVGWFENGKLVSESPSFNYLVGTDNVTLTAQYAYNPINPDEPTNNAQDDVDVSAVSAGDISEDGTIDVGDKVMLVNHYLNGSTATLSAKVADVNNDGSIDIGDAVEIINLYLNSK